MHSFMKYLKEEHGCYADASVKEGLVLDEAAAEEAEAAAEAAAFALDEAAVGGNLTAEEEALNQTDVDCSMPESLDEVPFFLNSPTPHTPFSPYVAPRFPHMSEIHHSFFWPFPHMSHPVSPHVAPRFPICRTPFPPYVRDESLFFFRSPSASQSSSGRRRRSTPPSSSLSRRGSPRPRPRSRRQPPTPNTTPHTTPP